MAGATTIGGASAPLPAWEQHAIMGCVDCLMFVANGDEPEGETDWKDGNIEHHWPSAEGWQLAAGDSDQDDDFSWEPCQCCGSPLGGSRHQLVAMRQVRP